MKKIVRLHFMSIKYHLKINNQNACNQFLHVLSCSQDIRGFNSFRFLYRDPDTNIAHLATVITRNSVHYST